MHIHLYNVTVHGAIHMIITCPKCSARYAVTSAAIGPAGRDVRCKKCAHTWYQTPPEEDLSAAPPPPPVMEDPRPRSYRPQHLPVPRPPSGAPLWLMALSVALVLAGGGLSLYAAQPALVAHHPAIGALYGAVGLYDTRGVVLADVKVKSENTDRYPTFNVTGTLMNEAKHALSVPTVRIIFIDKYGSVLDSWDFSQAGKIILPGQALPFRADKLQVKSLRQAYAVVEIGNAAQLSLRD